MKIFKTKVFTTYLNTKKSYMVNKMFLSKINVTIFPIFGFFIYHCDFSFKILYIKTFITSLLKFNPNFSWFMHLLVSIKFLKIYEKI